MLLHYAGDEVCDIYETLPVTATADSTSGTAPNAYKLAVDQLTKHFDPKANYEYQRCLFRQERQLGDESIDTYHTRIRHIAMLCGFTDLDAELKSHIIQTCSSATLRRKSLHKPDMTLTQLLELARTTEMADRQAKSMESALAGLQNVTLQVQTHRPSRSKGKDVKEKDLSSRQQNDRTCGHCGGTYPHRSELCPARGQICNSCGKANHFARVCRSSRRPERRPERRPLDETNTLTRVASTESIFQTDDRHKKLPQASITYGSFGTTKAIIDSGATVNTMGEHTFNLLTRKPCLQTSTRQIFPYGSSKPLHIL
ncbi:unnamed protein product, partial [Ixodes pacificus]